MRYALSLLALAVLSGCAIDNTAHLPPSSAKPTDEAAAAAAALLDATTTRRFEFWYDTEIEVAEDNSTVDLWLPIPQSGEAQEVTAVKLGDGLKEIVDSTHGNKIAYGHWEGVKAGTLSVSMKFTLTRREWTTNFRGIGQVELSDATAFALELGPNRTIPLDSPQVEAVFADIQSKWDGSPPGTGDFPAHTGNTVRVARRIYDHVMDMMWYEKPDDPTRAGFGRGDANWACDARYGNCTDFHSLFIALCRKSGIPARFEMGFSIPGVRSLEAKAKVGGYHCWAMFYVEGSGWVPVDISEADKHPDLAEYYFGALTEDRFTVGVGRDLTPDVLPVGLQETGSFNFLVYPACDINGENAGAAVSRSFWYRDLE